MNAEVYLELHSRHSFLSQRRQEFIMGIMYSADGSKQASLKRRQYALRALHTGKIDYCQCRVMGGSFMREVT